MTRTRSTGSDALLVVATRRSATRCRTPRAGSKRGPCTEAQSSAATGDAVQ